MNDSDLQHLTPDHPSPFLQDNIDAETTLQTSNLRNANEDYTESVSSMKSFATYQEEELQLTAVPAQAKSGLKVVERVDINATIRHPSTRLETSLPNTPSQQLQPKKKEPEETYMDSLGSEPQRPVESTMGVEVPHTLFREQEDPKKLTP